MTHHFDDPQKLHWSVEQFMYREADLLDERSYREWLDLLHDDYELQVPLRRNVHSTDLDLENSREGHDALWFDEGKDTLSKRVTQIETGEHWAEEPVSRVTHMVSNVRIVSADAPEVVATSRFLVYRNRVDSETNLLVGRRTDTLLAVEGGGWSFRRRRVLIDQSVLLVKSLTMFL